MRYFFYDKSHEENKEMFRDLCKRYHPDKPTGNDDMMKEINAEWELYEKEYRLKIDNFSFGSHIIEEDEEESRHVIFRGKKYYGCEGEILESISLKYGGITLMEFINSKEWKDYLDAD